MSSTTASTLIPTFNKSPAAKKVHAFVNVDPNKNTTLSIPPDTSQPQYAAAIANESFIINSTSSSSQIHNFMFAIQIESKIANKTDCDMTLGFSPSPTLNNINKMAYAGKGNLQGVSLNFSTSRIFSSASDTKDSGVSVADILRSHRGPLQIVAKLSIDLSKMQVSVSWNICGVAETVAKICSAEFPNPTVPIFPVIALRSPGLVVSSISVPEWALSSTEYNLKGASAKIKNRNDDDCCLNEGDSIYNDNESCSTANEKYEYDVQSCTEDEYHGVDMQSCGTDNESYFNKKFGDEKGGAKKTSSALKQTSAGPKQRQVVTLSGHASFQYGKHHWSSHQAKVTFKLLCGKNNRALVEKVWCQRCNESKQFVFPHFSDGEMKRLRKLAVSIFLARANGKTVTPVRRVCGNTVETHRQELCERCIHLGRSCTETVPLKNISPSSPSFSCTGSTGVSIESNRPTSNAASASAPSALRAVINSMVSRFDNGKGCFKISDTTINILMQHGICDERSLLELTVVDMDEMRIPVLSRSALLTLLKNVQSKTCLDAIKNVSAMKLCPEAEETLSSIKKIFPPEKVIEPFEVDFGIEGIIGSGRLGMVLRGKLKDGRDCAVKVMSDRAIAIEQAKVYLALQHHPNITRFFGISVAPESGRTLLILELASSNLNDLLTSCSRSSSSSSSSDSWFNDASSEDSEPPSALPLSKIRSYVHDIAAGLSHLHSKGINHCDLKPSNVLVFKSATEEDGNEEETLKLVDFGSAGVRTLADSTGDEELLVPELWELRGATRTCTQFAPAFDVFSFGILLLQMLAGKCYRNLRNAIQLDIEKFSHFQDDAKWKDRPCADFDIDVECDSEEIKTEGKDLITLCRKCLMMRKEDRLQSGGEVIKFLLPPTFR